MEQSFKKRKLTGTGATQPTAKKSKVRRVVQKPKSATKRHVSADKLRWRSAKLPEMFDDAEGFYGLEEVDDVEVVKREDNTVEFRATANGTKTSEASDEDDEFGGFDDLPMPKDLKSFTPDSTPTIVSPEGQAPAPSGAEQGQTPTEKDLTKKVKTTDNTTKKKEKKQKKKDQARSTAEESELQSNVFSALDAVEDADDDADVSAWLALGLSPQMLSSLAKLKFSKPTLIQEKAIPAIVSGHDVIGKASTGSGKTLAFAIPMVEKWLDLQERRGEMDETSGPLGLILSPTRELAHQITDHIKALCSGLGTAPYVCSVTGGLSVLKQQRQLAKADIVVGTPGRLWEVLSSSPELMNKFKAIEFLVIDEADRLLTEGHFKEAEEIFKGIDRHEADEGDEEAGHTPRQTLVFSATFHKGLQQKLAGKGKFGLMDKEDSMEYLLKKLNFREEKPRFIDVNPVSQMAEGLKEGLVECGAMEKDLYLYTLLLLYPNARTLVFTNSISAARRISPMLQNLNLPSNPLHSQMAQKARLRSIERFTDAGGDKASILIATDVAARGLDIPDVDLVVHYHVPRAADTYVHRSGRTARAQKTGLSILLCAPEETVPTRRLIAKVHSESKKGTSGKNFFVQTLDLDRKLAGRLKPRVTLAKKIADAHLAKEKGTKEDDWMRNAAEELGVEYDSEDMDQAGKWGGRGRVRKEKQEAARNLSKAELGALRAELRALLSRRVNAGVSEKYIATGLVDVDELLKGAKGDFLGRVDGLDIESL